MKTSSKAKIETDLLASRENNIRKKKRLEITVSFKQRSMTSLSMALISTFGAKKNENPPQCGEDYQNQQIKYNREIQTHCTEGKRGIVQKNRGSVFSKNSATAHVQS